MKEPRKSKPSPLWGQHRASAVPWAPSQPPVGNGVFPWGREISSPAPRHQDRAGTSWLWSVHGFRPNILELSAVPRKGSVLRKAVLPLPTLQPILLAVSRGKLETRLAMFLLGGRNPLPAVFPELEKGWEKIKQMSFQNQFVSNH